MIEIVQSLTLLMVIIVQVYQLRSFRILDDRLREIELKELDRLKRGK